MIASPLRALAAGALLWLAFAMPDQPGNSDAAHILRLPLELPAALIGLSLLTGWARIAARVLLVALLTALALLRVADLATYAAFARPFNPSLDRDLIPAGVRLVAGTIGAPLTALLCLGVALLVFALALALWWASGRFAPPAPLSARTRGLLALGLLAALLPLGLDLAGRSVPFGAAGASRLMGDHLAQAVAASEDLARFRAAAARDPAAALPAEAILPALRGHDIFVVFVESYGRAALDNPLHGPAIRATLAASAPRLEAAGLGAASGWLTAPMIGGQSWFAHGTLLSGLRIDSQGRYGALIASPRLTLPRLAQRAGWRSIAVMPAITLPWPEATYFGYDLTLAAKDLGYRGEPFNWVTMPDQFTLAAFERIALDPAPRAPVVAEIALISSHAPWTPIPPMLPWSEIGDGTVFDQWARGGESPEALWRDPDKVRVQYRRAVDYALQTVFSFAERRGPSAPLFLVLGDHQAAGIVTGGIGGQDVPVHLLGPPDLVARAVAAWGWTPGLIPAPELAPWPMEALRDRFLAAFGPGL